MKHKINSHAEALKLSWDLLEKATHRPRDPFYTPAIATVAGDRADLRTVVLRKVSRKERTLWFFSDIRAGKISEIRQTASVGWLFWNPRKLLQLRIRSKAVIHHMDQLAQDQWEKVPPVSRMNYSALIAPGTEAPADAQIYPVAEQGADSMGKALDEAQKHFALVNCQVDHIDVLHLHPEGHQRLELVWKGGEWKGSWLVP
jgi:hypothetical protein